MGRVINLTVGSVVILALGIYIGYPPPRISSDLLTWMTQGKYFSYQGNQIFYKDVRGMKSGPVLVCIHGFPSFSYDWKPIWSSLQGKFKRIIAPDLLGFGFSDKPLYHNYTIAEQADIIEAMLKLFGLKSVHLLAHDYGDTVAQELLYRYNKRSKEGSPDIVIKSVCLLNGGIFPETNHPKFVQKMLRVPVLGSILSRISNFYTFKKGFGDVFGEKTQPTETEFKDYWAAVRIKDGNLVLPGLLQYIPERRANRDLWVTNALTQTTVPIHMIYGPADPVNLAPAFENLYKDIVPNPSITVLPDHISHYPQIEAPSLVTKSYFEFLEKVLEK